MMYTPVYSQEGKRVITEPEYERIVDNLGINDTKKIWKLREDLRTKKDEEEEEEIEYVERPPAKKSGDGFLLKLVAYLVIIGLVIAIIYMVFSSVKVDKKINLKDKEIDIDDIEDIEDIDAVSAYKSAILAGDYRLAIRMQFIKCLQTLSTGGYIDWEKEKTNRDYAREISQSELRRSFRELATIFERCWYGDVSLDRISFQSYDQKFLTFLNATR